MNILFVTQFFYPENFRINDLALRLTDKGHKVTVLTGEPNYPSGVFFDGYSAFSPKQETWNGIDIIRVPVIPRRTGSKWLCLNYASFIITGCLKAASMALKQPKYDVIYAFGTSPITQALPAIIYKKFTGTKIIINVQDLWPDNVIAITGLKNKLAISLLDRLVDYIYNNCNVILGTSRSFVKAIRSRSGLKQRAKVGYYPQYSVVNPSHDKRHDIIPQDGRFHIVFTGNIGDGQGLDLLVDAVLLLDESTKNKIRIELVGDGRKRHDLEEKVHSLSLDNIIRFHGSFPESDIPSILNTADAGLLILKPDPIFDRTIPAKLQTYLACGCPVLGCCGGESKEIITASNIGLCTENQSASSLAKTISDFALLDKTTLTKFSYNATAISEREFDADKLICKLEEYMKRLC